MLNDPVLNPQAYVSQSSKIGLIGGVKHKENVFRQLLRTWGQTASSCCDSLGRFVVDIGPVMVDTLSYLSIWIVL